VQLDGVRRPMIASPALCDHPVTSARRNSHAVLVIWLLEVLVYTILELLIMVVGHGIARLLLPLLSFRRIQIQPLCGPSARFNLLGGYRRVSGGRIEIERTAAGGIGLLIGFSACAAIVLLARTAA
jgi:hypothetical protein